MKHVHRAIADVFNDWDFSVPAKAVSHPSSATSPYPYGVSGWLTAAPWEGLYLEGSE